MPFNPESLRKLYAPWKAGRSGNPEGKAREARTRVAMKRRTSRRMNPRSLANLCPPWKPGQSGNPAGRPLGSRYGFTSWKSVREAFREAIRRDMEKAKEQASAPVEPIAIAPQHEPTIEEMEVEARTETRCKVCQHENRAEIDGLLSLGFPLRSITQIFGLRKSSVDRHRQNHLPLFPNSEKAHQVVRGEEALHVPLLLLRDARYWAATGIINRLWDILMRILGNSPRDELCRCIIQASPISGRSNYSRGE